MNAILEKKSLPSKPGVYYFLDAQKNIVYVGKARDLKKRVSQYFQKKTHDAKTEKLMQTAMDVEFTITENENQALLLESNLIKEHHPKYNVLLRDDKSYPYLFLSTHDVFPRLDCHRGEKKQKGLYFGPYPNAGSVRENLSLIQKLFQVRQCSDAFFKTRSRPCLQYQIKRCTAPCVNFVSRDAYKNQVDNAVQFLEGKNKSVITALEKNMQDAAQSQHYEAAAHARDLLIRLRKLQSQQYVIHGDNNVDVFAIVEKSGLIAVTVLTVRYGQLLGHKTFFPNIPAAATLNDVLSAFIPQYYLNDSHHQVRIDRIIVNQNIQDRLWLQNALQSMLHISVKIISAQSKVGHALISIAMSNAKQALQQSLQVSQRLETQFHALQTWLQLSEPIERIECFDISHTMGESTKGACVVFDKTGPDRRAYRIYNVDGITAGDDYGALENVLTRRYEKMKAENKPLPDVIVIDGGRGQLHIAQNVLEYLQLSQTVLLSVAKGAARKRGREKIFRAGVPSALKLNADDSAFHLIQFIRDEAHRFAITKHRKARHKTRFESPLDKIDGIGKKRKQVLLLAFGGFQELKKASVDEIAAVKGIARDLAEKIYETLHH